MRFIRRHPAIVTLLLAHFITRQTLVDTLNIDADDSTIWGGQQVTLLAWGDGLIMMFAMPERAALGRGSRMMGLRMDGKKHEQGQRAGQPVATTRTPKG